MGLYSWKTAGGLRVHPNTIANRLRNLCFLLEVFTIWKNSAAKLILFLNFFCTPGHLNLIANRLRNLYFLRDVFAIWKNSAPKLLFLTPIEMI